MTATTRRPSRCCRSRGDDEYLRHVLRVHGADILRFNPDVRPRPGAGDQDAFLVSSGDETVGVVLLRAEGDTAHVLLDYVTPRYRDFSPGEFVWRQSGMLADHGYRRVVTPPDMVGAYYDRARLPPRRRLLGARADAMITTLDPPRAARRGRRDPPRRPRARAVAPAAGGRRLLPPAAWGTSSSAAGRSRDPGHLGPFDTADWFPTQWLAQIGMAAIEDRAGLAGVMWVAGVLVLGLALAVYVVLPPDRGPVAGRPRHDPGLLGCQPRVLGTAPGVQLPLRRSSSPPRGWRRCATAGPAGGWSPWPGCGRRCTACGRSGIVDRPSPRSPAWPSSDA